MKRFLALNRIRKESPWLIITTTSVNSLNLYAYRLSKFNIIFFSSVYLRVFVFYIRKVLKKRFRKPIFLTSPYRWLTSKPKGSRMGKGKGGPKLHFFPLMAGQILLSLPIFESFLLVRLVRSLSLRLPFALSLLPVYRW